MESAFTSAAMEFCAEPLVFQKPRWAITWVDCACMQPHVANNKAEVMIRLFSFIAFRID